MFPLEFPRTAHSHLLTPSPHPCMRTSLHLHQVMQQYEPMQPGAAAGAAAAPVANDEQKFKIAAMNNVLVPKRIVIVGIYGSVAFYMYYLARHGIPPFVDNDNVEADDARHRQYLAKLEYVIAMALHVLIALLVMGVSKTVRDKAWNDATAEKRHLRIERNAWSVVPFFVAFVTLAGVRYLWDELDFAAAFPQYMGTALLVVTTSLVTRNYEDAAKLA